MIDGPESDSGYHHKDASPNETVARIQKLLCDIGISLAETAWYDGVANTCSLTVCPERLKTGHPQLYTNGKGMDKDLARASAFAEFMERLQNSSRQTPVLVKSSFGLMPKELRIRPTPAVAASDNCWRRVGQLAPYSISTTDRTRDAAQEVVCFPFYNVFGGQLEMLPASLLFRATGSNGMASGNTAEEALTQALCEIMERHAASRAFFEYLRLPTIPLSSLVDLRAHECLRSLQATGLRVMVKDCTFGGKYPVLAVVAYDPKRNRYALCFGSDPVLDIALQRCVTEVSQGSNQADFSPGMQTVEWDETQQESRLSLHDTTRETLLHRFMGDRSGRFVASILLSEGEPCQHKAFLDSGTSNRQQLHHLLGQLKSDGYQVLVRDCSYLGFPAYFVFVPGMSTEHHSAKISLEERDAWAPWRLLASLADASPDDISRWLETAEKKCDAEIWPEVPRWFRLIVDEECGVRRLFHPYMLLAELSCRIGDYRRAFGFLSKHINLAVRDEITEIENLDYAWCALAAIKLKAMGRGDEETHASLTHLFGADFSSEVLGDMASPNQPLQNCILPRCGDCGVCPLHPHCFYQPWSELVDALNRKMAKSDVDQTRLAELFSTLEC